MIGRWQQDSSPENTRAMLTAINPMVVSSARQYTTNPSPVVIGRAKLDVLKALKRYNPKESKPQTFISRQLQGLSRWEASKVNGVRIPVRASMQSRNLDKVTESLESELGRTPSTAEIARRANLTVGAVADIRSFARPVVGSQQQPSAEGGGSPGLMEDQTLQPQNDQAWLEMVYDDLPEKDRIVMEHTIGLFGRPKLSTSELAKKLRLSAGAVSQRRKRVQAYIDRAMQVNPF